MNKVMVTGGAGFIGSQLIRDLLQDGFEVLVYDNMSTGKQELLPAGQSGLTTIEADILHPKQLEEVMLRFDPEIVFRLAAIHYIPYCNAHPFETIQVNVAGTQAVLEVCKTINVKRIVVASSAAIYPVSDNPHSETQATEPCDIYGLSKCFSESLVQRFHEDTGKSCMIARIFNVFGPRETNPHVIPHILEQLAKTDEVQLGNIDSQRDFIYVEDVSRALIMLAQWDGARFDIFNVGSGHEYSVREIVETCELLLKKPIKITSLPSLQRKVDRRHLSADISKMNSLVGWQTKYNLFTGLQKLLSEMLLL